MNNFVALIIDRGELSFGYFYIGRTLHCKYFDSSYSYSTPCSLKTCLNYETAKRRIVVTDPKEISKYLMTWELLK